MDPDIQAVINSCHSLTLKENKGEKFRVMKQGMKGSLWLEHQKNAYRLKLTGQVVTYVSNFVNTTVGPSSREDQGYPLWYLPFDGSMESVVRYLDEIEV